MPIHLPPHLSELSIVILSLSLVVIIVNLKMLQNGLNGMGDLYWHSLWIEHFSKELSEGILYPRWLPGVNYGYGNPTFVFYPPLVYYLGSGLRIGGLDLEKTIIFLFCLALFLSGFNFYLYSRVRWGIMPAFIGSLTYMSAPYVIFNTYWIASVSVAFAIAWVPLGFWLTEEAMQKPKWRKALALSWTILALIHIPTLLLCAVVWIPYILLFLLWRPWKIVVANIIYILIGLGLASFFLFPAILEQSYISVDSHIVAGGFKNTMFGSGLHLFPLNFDLYLPQIFLQQLLAILILGLVTLTIFCDKQEIFKQSKYWLIFALILTFMMTSWSWPIWATSYTLRKVQAPFRLLHLFSFAEATLCVILISGLSQKKLKLLIRAIGSLIIILILTTNFIYAYHLSHKFPTFHELGNSRPDYNAGTRKALFSGYTEDLKEDKWNRPLLSNKKPSPDPIPRQPLYSLLNGQATIKLLQWKGTQRILEIEAKKISTIKIRTYNYPAWHLYVNEKLHPTTIADDGTIQVKLDPGFSKLELVYQWTPALILGTIVSILSGIVLIILEIKGELWRF